MCKKLVVICGMALAMSSLFAAAQQAPSGCTNAQPLPTELAGWCTRTAIEGVGDLAGVGAATLEVGQGFNATLRPIPEIHFVVSPGKTGDAKSYGGLFAFKVDRTGNYRVAISSTAWADVVKDGKAIASKTHSHGPDGSGMHKLVDFSLTPGLYTLQLAANAENTVSLMVARAP